MWQKSFREVSEFLLYILDLVSDRDSIETKVASQPVNWNFQKAGSAMAASLIFNESPFNYISISELVKSERFHLYISGSHS